MIRKSTWLVLCLCGLLVMMIGCKKKEETGLPMKENVAPPPSSFASPTVPTIPDGKKTTPDANTDTITPVAPSKGGDLPTTARQAADQKKAGGASMEELETYEVPK